MKKSEERGWIITLWKSWRVIKILGLMTALVYTGAFAWLFSKLINGYVMTIYPDAMNVFELPMAVFGVIAVGIEVVEHIQEGRKGVLKRL